MKAFNEIVKLIESPLEKGYSSRDIVIDDSTNMTIPVCSITNGAEPIADLFDISRVDTQNQNRVVVRCVEDANSEMLNKPYYIFINNGQCWKGLYYYINGLDYVQPTKTDPHFEQLADIDFSFNPDTDLWITSVHEVAERINNCSTSFLKTKALNRLMQIIEEWNEGNKGYTFVKRVIKVIKQWVYSDIDDVLVIHNNHINLNRNYEDCLFQAILGNVIPKKIYKYSSLDTLSYILNDNTHSMSSIACMNDKSECFYADNKKSLRDSDNMELSLLLNYKTFITSFTIHCPQQLKMWRLYGQNGKGISIEYDLEQMNLTNEFILAPVSYQEECGTHIELDFIQYILSKAYYGFKLQLKRWYIWQHFFKPFDYKEENEIRLLYTPKDDTLGKLKWVTANGIYSPMIVFSLKKDEYEYPLYISKIFLGPGFKEPNTNALLMNEKLRSAEQPFKIDTIEIKHYRANDD